MSRDPELYLSDLVLAAESLIKYTDGMTEVEFKHDSKTVHACMKCIQIAGEAVKKLPEEWKQSEPEIPWPQISGMRNILVHDEAVLWKTIQVYVPKLLLACERIRNRVE
jgi:uncharacterized protein with HEPN domain